MKIKRAFNGVEVEIELTQDEIAEAYLEHEHYYDCESVRGDLNSGCYEEFEGLSDEEWEAAVHEIAYEARHQMEEYGFDAWDAQEVARKKYIEGHNLGDTQNDIAMKINSTIHETTGDIYEVRLEPNRFILVEASNSGVVGILGDMPERSAPLVYDKEDHLYPNFEYDERAVTQFVLDYIKEKAQKDVDSILGNAQERAGHSLPHGKEEIVKE